jgi:hypothetical protein
MRRGRLLFLLGNAALIVAWLSQFRPHGSGTWSDGH